MNPTKVTKTIPFDKAIPGFAYNFLRFNIRHYRLIPFFLKIIYNQKKGLAKRAENKNNGIQVPTVLAVSITSKCNLNCIGCYYKSQKRKLKDDLSDKEIRRIFSEAHELGIRIILLLGGEPFTRDVFKLTDGFDDILFGVYTNSTLIDDDIIKTFRKRHNIIPVLSLEGYSGTDKRRGEGVLANIKRIAKLFIKNKIFYGLSYTVTRFNFDEIIQDDFIRNDIKNGCSLFNFFEYMPIDPNTYDLMLTKEQKIKYVEFLTPFKDTYKAHILSPVLETVKHGGCAGARDVAHISSDGFLEPCPFIAFSDTSVRDIPLEKAFRSKFLSIIRNQVPYLEERPEHSCKLFAHRDWVRQTAEKEKLSKAMEENAQA